MIYNKITLNFKAKDHKYEEQYRYDSYVENIKIIRLAILIGIFIYSLFSFIDIYLTESTLKFNLILRFLFIFPLGLVIYGVSFIKSFRKRHQLLLSVALFLGGFVILLMINNSSGENPYRFVGLILLIIFGNSFFRLRFIWIALVSIALIICFQIVLQIGMHLPEKEFVTINVYLIIGAVLSLVSSYTLEYISRKNFYLNKRLVVEINKETIENLDLEDIIVQRTNKLIEFNQELSKEIKQRKEAQNELQNYQKYLENIVSERTLELRNSLEEKDRLLSEIHHRVKNNMQMISSILQLQLNYSGEQDARALFQTSLNRIKAIAMIHEKLYRNNDKFGEIEIGTYLENLVNELVSVYRSNKFIEVKFDKVAIELEIDSAITLGLLVNEIVINSLKYAFDEREQGEISVLIKKINRTKIYMEIRDNGVGYSLDKEIVHDSLGKSLIRGFIAELFGTYEVFDENGLCYKIMIEPKRKSKHN